MKVFSFLHHSYTPKNRNRDWRAIFTLILGILFTFFTTIFTYNIVEQKAKEEFGSVCNEIEIKIATRLQAHVLILQAGAAYFTVSDTVTRNNWKEFIARSQVDKNLPGIQGVGFSLIIPPTQLEQNITRIRQEGFPDYKVYPEGKRDIYTSIIYLEPFTGRNLRAFGYDMFSQPTRRKAMEQSRDNNMATLSGKVDLVQETDEDVQSGTLMYVPLYKHNMPTKTVEDRRKAIKGWIYSPYRMDDLMRGILGRWDNIELNRIHMEVYDDSISVNSLLYDSQKNNQAKHNISSVRTLSLPVEFNGKEWILYFTQSRQNSWFNGYVLIVFISGIIITILLYLLMLTFAKVAYRSSQIRNQNEELKKINATKDRFFSIIAHDLRSPFGAIVGYSHVLEKQVENKNYSGIARYAEIIQSSSDKAMALLMNLTEWSQSQTGIMKFNPEQLDMVELIHEAEHLFKDIADQKLIEISKVLPAEAYVHADRAMISTILRNLLSNAIKYSDPGGKIILSITNRANELIVSVADSGVGIPKHRIDKIFRIDENFTTAGTLNEKGTGLGLILCKEFVDNHNGKIWLESEEGKGSVFYFSLPLNEQRFREK
jgi:signal transduction histidine kinase